ncbi:MAG: IS1634 family transposase, partial [Myxococcota bacterium]
TVWKIYNTIREIESTFRVLKTDLKMRPIYHQRSNYTESHIFGSLLAYTMVNTIRHNLKGKDIRDSWTTIVQTMSTQKVVNTSIKNRRGDVIYIKKITKPLARVSQIYEAIGLRERAFYIKKSVLPKIDTTISQPTGFT